MELHFLQRTGKAESWDNTCQTVVLRHPKQSRHNIIMIDRVTMAATCRHVLQRVVRIRRLTLLKNLGVHACLGCGRTLHNKGKVVQVIVCSFSSS